MGDLGPTAAAISASCSIPRLHSCKSSKPQWKEKCAFTIVHHQLFIRLAQQHQVPAVYNLRTYVARGALMSYGPDPYDNVRRSASYVDRILKGAKPADLPVQQPTKFELAINLKTAKALGLKIPDKLLALADEVIE
jgi:putative tryptophan/tyrosine transport system substrate-binding protein